jgi:leader peptidase (prepilin peptidase)/N-methyltransferase
VIDWRTYDIPQSINLFILSLGIVGVIADYANWMSYLIGLLCVSGFLYFLYVITKGRGIGGGDIKLMAAAGLLLGWKGIVFAFFAGCIIGSVCHLLRMAISKDKNRVLAFGPYLSIGIVLAVFFTEAFYDWYISLIM